MRDLADITISKAILHRVAPNKRQEKYLSQGVLTLTEPVQDFLLGHIKRGLGSGRAATFEKPEPTGNHVAGWCAQAAVGRRRTFIERSQSIAEAMYTEMARNKNISDAVLAVIAFQAAPPDGAQGKYLALLKLDPGDGFKPTKQRDGTLGITVTEDVLPSTREGLQKCAFVNPDYAREHQLAVLDVQTAGQDPSRWFLDGFLDAAMGDEIQLTRDLNTALYEARGRLEQRLDTEEMARFDAAVDGLWAGSTADAERLVREVELDEADADIVLDAVDAHVADRTFTIDRKTADKNLAGTRFKADNNIEVKAPANAFRNRTITVVPDEHDQDIHVVTIRTRRWEPA